MIECIGRFICFTGVITIISRVNLQKHKYIYILYCIQAHTVFNANNHYYIEMKYNI